MAKIPKSFTKVTPLSKTLALLLFILLPFVAFRFGMKYQQAIDTVEFYNQQLELNTLPPHMFTITPTPTPLIKFHKTSY